MKLKKKNAFPIIAIGSSAGGIPVIQKITGKLPTLFNAAILFMQHLSPDHKSLLPELLSNQRPDLHFAEMRNNDELQAGLLYLPVPGKNIQIESGIFKTSDFSDVLHLPIDTLFTSLAKEYQERVTGIILSGSGKDGNRGCAEIRDSGGTVIVQDPATAEFGSMPQSVIKTAYFDQILPPEKIISEIIRIIEAQSASGFFDELIKPDRVSALVDILYKKTGYRFDHYKPTVIARRVQRRMQLNGFNDVNLYFNTLANNDTEASLITNDMMIGVTRFFRDYSQWEMLRESVVVPLLTITSNRPVRVWCAGCSTGEEAYSIGMLFMLEMEKRRIKRELQIFATDINEKAIDKARKGIYFENILTDIPPEYLRRFFICLSDGHTLEVVNEVREQIVFSKQDILRDLPFSKIDLCVCRNVLIYMTPEAQNKCTLIFHYALREEGFLFLGTSEGIEPQSDLFKQYSSEKFHIFRRIPGAHPKLPVPEHPMTTETLKQDVGHAPVQPGNDEFFYRIQAEALEILGAAVLVVDKDFRIIYQSEASTRYLMLSDSKILYNFFTVLPANLHNQIRAVFRSMQEGENPVVVDGNMINSVGVIVPVAITLSKIPDRVEQYLIILQKKVSNPKVEADLLTVETDIGSPSRAIHLLEKELAATRYDLQKHIGQLRSMNEEMQTANEELQTSNEELETSEEELRTINEELMSTNSQLQAKIEELERIQAILRDSEEKYRTLADNAPEVIARFDLQFRHTFVNEYGTRVYGVSRDQVIGKTNADLGMPADKVAFWNEHFKKD